MASEIKSSEKPASVHKYKAGTRLSSAYTDGVNGKPFAKHHGGKTSAAYKAWLEGSVAKKTNTDQ